jgi:lipoyl(octanoyl) transferase
MQGVQTKTIQFEDLGLTPYKMVWGYQQGLLDEKVAQKFKNRDLPESEQVRLPDHLLFCEHPHVITLGKSGKEANLLVSQDDLRKENIDFYKINRGGDITYHGPGQLMGYPILDLDFFYTDIIRYLRNLEEVFVEVLAYYGLKGERSTGETGLWLDLERSNPRKILALGVRCSRWVTMHGFGFNVNTQLDYFKRIVPCGINDKGVTSLQAELGREIDMEEVKTLAKKAFERIFEVRLSA